MGEGYRKVLSVAVAVGVFRERGCLSPDESSIRLGLDSNHYNSSLRRARKTRRGSRISVGGYCTRTEVVEAVKRPRCSVSVSLEKIYFASKSEEGEQSAPEIRPGTSIGANDGDAHMESCFKCRQRPTAGDKLRVCGGCRTVKFCSDVCLRAAWREHKILCKTLGAATTSQRYH